MMANYPRTILSVKSRLPHPVEFRMGVQQCWSLIKQSTEDFSILVPMDNLTVKSHFSKTRGSNRNPPAYVLYPTSTLQTGRGGLPCVCAGALCPWLPILSASAGRASLRLLHTPKPTEKKIIIIMSIFLECLSKWSILNCAEQVQIQKYKTHAYKTLKTAGFRTIMLKHPTKQ